MKHLSKLPAGFEPFKVITKQELIRVGSVLLKSDIEGLKRLKYDPQAPAMLACVASILLTIHETGDMVAFDRFLDRMIGKVRAEIELQGAIGGNNQGTVVVTMPSNGREVRQLKPVSNAK